VTAFSSKLPSQLIARAAVFKALGHPSRLLMVEALRDRERCVSELTGLVGADVSTVSKHLALMKATGLVASEKRGLHIYYRLLDRRVGDPANHPGSPAAGQLAV
jgi:DNA-binding transcriptional ArsR family regulator